MAKICISRMVVAIGSYKRNMPIRIAIIPSKKPTTKVAALLQILSLTQYKLVVPYNISP